MRSNSSRNLSAMASASGSGSSARRYPHASGRQFDVPADKFIGLQLMQTLLFTFRISFLTYDIVHAVIHKEKVYRRIGKMVGGDPFESESAYTASLALLSLFLIMLIILTFIYNYFLVHENLTGIFLMVFYLIGLLGYSVWNFGRYSVMESAIVCSCSVGELLGLIYLIKLLKYKKYVRAITKAQERRISKSAFEAERNHSKKIDSSSPAGGRQMPHHRKRHQPVITVEGEESEHSSVSADIQQQANSVDKSSNSALNISNNNNYYAPAERVGDDDNRLQQQHANLQQHQERSASSELRHYSNGHLNHYEIAQQHPYQQQYQEYQVPPTQHMYEHSVSQLPHYYPTPLSGQPI